ncbi:uncharacterized protein B0H18DRAFT_1138954 [Fomitopsis serialis]|uniref:uncharacterized protein n=1 Tax=Fomitopsis serialis TaxID=139415 RepID=UPI002007CF5D|nr:uncharacterized protein B0H18DRAFT_1138954 [Neoantrodia serialis]KAH9931823.1 hypothetical protein B0H18DRAFT_1138954 [Neoantrodia serialis]
MADKKTLVLVLGATGRTGRSVIDGLLRSADWDRICPTYNIATLTRPASASKPEVDILRSQGVEIRIGDYATDPPSKLSGYLDGVDVLLSTVSAQAAASQKPILKTAVEAGVKRVIPCDFGTPGAKGVRALNDMKLEIREYLRELCATSSGLSTYTFIDIGWWMQYLVPTSSKVPSPIGPGADEYYAEDDKPVLLMDVDRIGPYVARIVRDARAANQYIIIWQDELTLRQSREIAESASGEAEAIRARRVLLDEETLLQRIAEKKAQYIASGEPYTGQVCTYSEYMISIHFLGENSLANAKRLGALDARELYPEIVPETFGLFAKRYYG